jgi:hypothetical protein
MQTKDLSTWRRDLRPPSAAGPRRANNKLRPVSRLVIRRKPSPDVGLGAAFAFSGLRHFARVRRQRVAGSSVGVLSYYQRQAAPSSSHCCAVASDNTCPQRKLDRPISLQTLYNGLPDIFARLGNLGGCRLANGLPKSTTKAEASCGSGGGNGGPGGNVNGNGNFLGWRWWCRGWKLFPQGYLDLNA